MSVAVPGLVWVGVKVDVIDPSLKTLGYPVKDELGLETIRTGRRQIGYTRGQYVVLIKQRVELN